MNVREVYLAKNLVWQWNGVETPLKQLSIRQLKHINNYLDNSKEKFIRELNAHKQAIRDNIIASQELPEIDLGSWLERQVNAELSYYPEMEVFGNSIATWRRAVKLVIKDKSVQMITDDIFRKFGNKTKHFTFRASLNLPKDEILFEDLQTTKRFKKKLPITVSSTHSGGIYIKTDETYFNREQLIQEVKKNKTKPMTPSKKWDNHVSNLVSSTKQVRFINLEA